MWLMNRLSDQFKKYVPLNYPAVPTHPPNLRKIRLAVAEKDWAKVLAKVLRK